MVRPMKNDINYLTAKLEEIHEDVKVLQGHVDELRQEYHGRKAISKFMFGALGIIGATVGWLVDNVLSLAKHVDFN